MHSLPSPILITGAAGHIGTHLRAAWANGPVQMITTDIVTPETLHPNERFTPLDLTDRDGLRALMAGAQAVVHLGGLSREGPWDEMMAVNIGGTYNLFEAARQCGVARVIYASSLHATGYYRTDQTLTVETPVRPSNLYGVSKCFGEALARNYYDSFGLQCLALRIGSFSETVKDARMLSSWLSPRDAVRLIEAGLTVEALGFQILYGVSDNAARWWQNPPGMLDGWVARDSADSQTGKVQPGFGPDAPQTAYQGGGFIDTWSPEDRDRN